MKAQMRRRLAGKPFEETLRKVARLVAIRASIGAAPPDRARQLGIRRKSVPKFSYNGKLRTVEPQTYGLSTTGREVFRAYERSATNASKRSGMAKLFDLKKISGLRKDGQSFRKASPAHHPDDTAMVEIFATLPPLSNQPIKHENMY